MNKLKMLRTAKDLTQKDIADFLDITPQAYGYYEQDKRQMTLDTAKKLAEFFNVPISYLIDDSDNKNVDDVGIKVPVLGHISAGLPLYAEQYIEDFEFAPSKVIKPGNEYFFLRVNGDSMNVLVQNGGLVLIERCSQIESGEIGVFLVDDENATIKKYSRMNNLVVLTPMSTNPIHQPQVYDPAVTSIKCLGKAVAYSGYLV